MKTLIISSALLIFALNVHAEEPRTPLEKYRGTTQFHLMMCELTLKNMRLKAELGETIDKKDNIYTCISNGKTKIKDSFSAAIGSVKSEKAKALLKEYHIAFLTALEGIAPNSDELVYAYKNRQSDLQGKVTESWNRFEVENL